MGVTWEDSKTSDLKCVESRHIVVGSVTPIYVLKAEASKDNLQKHVQQWIHYKQSRISAFPSKAEGCVCTHSSTSQCRPEVDVRCPPQALKAAFRNSARLAGQ